MRLLADKQLKPLTPSTLEQIAPFRDYLILLLITGLAAFVRFYSLSSITPGLWYDEAINGLDALSLIKENPFQLFFTTEAHPREPLFMYLIAGMFLLFGVSAEVLRSTSAVAGVLTIPLIYLLVKQLWGRRLALLTAFCLAVLRWHIHFSCLNFRTILVPLLEIPAFYFFIKGVKNDKWTNFLLCGLFVGLGFYAYPAFRFVPLILLGLILYLHFGGEFALKRNSPKILILFLMALLIFMPLLIDYLINPFHFSGRIQQVSLFDQGFVSGVKAILKNLWLVLLMFSIKGDPEPKHNVDFLPVFDIVTSILFYLGFYVMLKGLKKDRWYFLPLLWVAIMLLPTIFSFGAPNLLRTLAVTPAVVIILAFGFDRTYELLRRRFSSPIVFTIIAMLVGYFALIEYTQYVQWAKEPESWQRLNGREYQLALEAKRWAEKGSNVYIPQAIFAHPTIQFIIQSTKPESRDRIGMLRLPEALLRTGADKADNVIFLSEYSDLRLHHLLHYLYANANTRLLHAPWGEAWATLYQIDGAQLLTEGELEKCLNILKLDLSTIRVNL